MSKSKVRVSGDDAGNHIVKSDNNPEYGYIRVTQTKMDTDSRTGFAKMKEVSALVPGTITDLKGFGWTAGQTVDGNIRVVESLEPFNKKDPDKDLKIAGDSGVICTVEGQPIYRRQIFTFNANLDDELVQHDNEDDIKAAYASMKASSSAMQPNEDFNL
jgi:hypothetical protein